MNQRLTLCIILKTKLMHEVRLKKWHSPLKSASASAIQPVLPGVFELKKKARVCVCQSWHQTCQEFIMVSEGCSTSDVKMTL